MDPHPTCFFGINLQLAVQRISGFLQWALQSLQSNCIASMSPTDTSSEIHFNIHANASLSLLTIQSEYATSITLHINIQKLHLFLSIALKACF